MTDSFEAQADKLAQEIAAKQEAEFKEREERVYNRIETILKEENCTLKVEMIPQIMVIPLPNKPNPASSPDSSEVSAG